ncbi:MAG: glycosyltransferase family 2 protein [bacterium]|nr:glycosyltransferase family 2 protein [bacterium]
MATAIPRISILLPARNAEQTIDACLRSLMRQTERDWECVLVDDGSTDRTADLAREVAGSDRRLRIETSSHRGLVATLNAGLEQCRAELVARMDSDDVMHRERLARQLSHLERHPDHAAVGCHVRMFPRDELRDGSRNYEKWINGICDADGVRRERFVECPVAHPALMLRRDELTSLGGYRDMGWPEDYDLLLRLAVAERKVGIVPQRLLCWRDGPTRLSRTAEEYGLDRFTACKAAFLAAGFLAARERYVLWGYGSTGRALRRALAEHGKHPSHIVELHRGRLGNIIHGAPVIPPTALRDIPRAPLLVSVAGAGPRDEIRAELTAMGFSETHDFYCTA